VALRAGDTTPRDEAHRHARQGPSGARAAWALVAWALARDAAEPAVRVNLELVSRLSDRPSADRDMTFLFRLAAAKSQNARPMLETLAKGPLIASEHGVRAALHLARDYGLERFRQQLVDVLGHPKRDRLRGLAAAALFDLGDREDALAAVRADGDRKLPGLAWVTLVRAGASGVERGPLVTEPVFRRIELGWVE
jgi:hypothetical protein